MNNKPILALFESTNRWLPAIDRRMTEAEFHEIGNARHFREIASWTSALADWLCGTRKEAAKRLAYHILHANDPQVRMTSGVALQKLVAAPYKANFRFESLDDATVKFRVAGRSVRQDVTVTPAGTLTAVRDAIVNVRNAAARHAAELGRMAVGMGVPTVEPIELSACAHYQDLKRGGAHATIVELLDSLASPATFWAIKAALEMQRTTAMQRDLHWREWPVAAGGVTRRAVPDTLHFAPTLEITQPSAGVFQLAWHAEPEAPAHKCAHRAFDVVLLVTRAHMHCIYAR
ncbi:hypothetical protein AB870_24565 (plasmid) [Pandoraea faecigallinarum]|uniref:Uncharacterized protein n=1 Tax=Pandoraea faecigallinarum TaxID=656179 RepID=A0A0H3X065_9BURK|nr:hypothetical protein [Pandoraea faecigallinarum]AKM33362.1 hypothetical protein AB870_24565 [Pandoraea faecigallinarum]